MYDTSCPRSALRRSFCTALEIGFSTSSTRAEWLKASRELRNRLARSLPYGLQRKVEMARAVTARPKLLLLDEPVAGMNHDEAETIRSLMLKLRQDGLSILLIEHDMAFVMNLCDYLYVLDFGVLIAQGAPREIRTNPDVLDAYLGQAD